MKIHEYQAKELFRRYGIPVPAGVACLRRDDIDASLDAIGSRGGGVWVVKAQIHAGGRGKGGGVKVATERAQARAYAEQIFGMNLVTAQTGAAGQTVRRLLVEEGVNIADELYMSLLVDRARQQVVVMASSEGGMDIEQVAHDTPEKIVKMWVDPAVGVCADAARDLIRRIGAPAAALDQGVALVDKLYKLFDESDAALVEINPLVVTGGAGDLIALDAKVSFDDNALFRHPDYAQWRDVDEEDPMEREAAKHDLSYISLDGNIGCMVNGAGLAMATMDIIKLYGGEPANFLDVGGGASADKVAAAFQIMLGNADIKAILINIFGGIMQCDVIARGVTDAARQTQLSVPLVVRLEGTNVEQGREILAASGLTIISAATMADAAEKAVAAAGGGGMTGEQWRY